jgi:hypothetical protein
MPMLQRHPTKGRYAYGARTCVSSPDVIVDDSTSNGRLNMPIIADTMVGP